MKKSINDGNVNVIIEKKCKSLLNDMNPQRIKYLERRLYYGDALKRKERCMVAKLVVENLI